MVNKLDLATWYSEHSTQVFLLFAAPAAIAWFGYFENAENQYPMWLIIGAVLVTYYWSKKHLKNYCFHLVTNYAKEFAKKPEIEGNTTEGIIDATDIDIIGIIDGMEEDKGEYIKIIGSTDIVEQDELLRRLGKLKSLGYIHATARRVTLSSLGLGILDTSGVQQISIPAKFSTILAKAKLYFEEGNYNGVSDAINILFEEILRSLLEEKFSSDNLDKEWKKLREEGRVRREFASVSLGELLGVCNLYKLIKKGSVEDNTILSFLKLRTPQKHSVNKEQPPLQTAKNSLDLANVFIRVSFQR